MLAGCGSGSARRHTTTTTTALAAATPQSVQACLERDGYDVTYEVSHHIGHNGANGQLELDINDLGTAGRTREDIFLATGGSGLGEVSVSIFSSPIQAQQAAAESVHAAEESETKYKEERAHQLGLAGEPEPPEPATGKPGWTRNVAFVAWTDTALAINNVAACAETAG